MDDDAIIALARANFDQWIASLPAVVGNDVRLREEKLAAQRLVLTKLATPEERTALFLFAVSLFDERLFARAIELTAP